jgi:hypothetical protein
MKRFLGIRWSLLVNSISHASTCSPWTVMRILSLASQRKHAFVYSLTQYTTLKNSNYMSLKSLAKIHTFLSPLHLIYPSHSGSGLLYAGFGEVRTTAVVSTCNPPHPTHESPEGQKSISQNHKILVRVTGNCDCDCDNTKPKQILIAAVLVLL